MGGSNNTYVVEYCQFMAAAGFRPLRTYDSDTYYY